MTIASPVLSPAELVRLRAERPETRLLDVRTPGEFEAQHIPGAYNVPLDTLAEHGTEIRARVDAPVVLVCRSGQRARNADDALRAAGMTNLHVLDVMGMLIARLPHNRPASCDVPAMVRALTTGAQPVVAGRESRPVAASGASCGA